MIGGMLGGDCGFAARVLASLSSGIVGVDAAGRLALVNEGARRILGCPAGDPGDVLGRDCRSALEPQPRVAQLLLDALDGRAALSRAELVLEGSAQDARSTIGFTLAPVRDPEGRVCGAAMLFRDLTPFERSDEQERLRDRLAALGEMAAGLAHEIRNPLAGMEVLAGLLGRRLADRPEEGALVADFTEQLRRLAETVTHSLEFVRPVDLRRERLDPAELVEAALERALARAPRPDAIERHYAADLPPVAADPQLVGAAVTNLILNACEAMGDSGGRLVLGLCERMAPRPTRVVRVGADAADTAAFAPLAREIVLSVSDTGPGIAPELREKIFYPFFTTKQQGSGVGLAQVQKIAVGHGGSVALECGAAGGCTFRVHLPVEPEPT
jgi:nitrogen-specific signal transduction histidine kinase